LAFAEAGAARLVLLGRKEKTLSETASALGSKVKVSSFAADVTDERALRRVAGEVGSWDIMILNAGYLSAPAAIKDASVTDWWQSFEVCSIVCLKLQFD
jgi:NADP-dependent 3-hydroxy acid dehydrogenase YdfG